MHGKKFLQMFGNRIFCEKKRKGERERENHMQNERFSSNTIDVFTVQSILFEVDQSTILLSVFLSLQSPWKWVMILKRIHRKMSCCIAFSVVFDKEEVNQTNWLHFTIDNRKFILITMWNALCRIGSFKLKHLNSFLICWYIT